MGSTMKLADSTTSNATPPGEMHAGNEEMDRLANMVRAGANIGGIDPETERDPPARALRLVFPETTTTPAVRWSDDHPPPDFQRLFASIKRAEAPLTGHLRALNCDHQPCGQGEALLPLREDGDSYIPPKAREEKEFADRIAELDITNDAAFRALSRTTKPGKTAPRIAKLRRFWVHLDEMAQYWDTTADQNYSINVPVDPSKSGPDDPTKIVKRYKGRRTGNGRDMPDTYRANTVNAFVEGVTSAFNCRVSQPWVAPKRWYPAMQIGRIELPVRLTGMVLRLPTDRDKARAGVLEGPVMGILERNTIDFISDATFMLSPRMSEHDLLREIAAMLLIAQQRAREGVVPNTQSDDKWWETKPRWGGGPGSKVPGLQECEDNYAKILARIAEAGSESTKDMKAQERNAKERLKRTQDVVKGWTTLASVPSLWNKRFEYKAIGKSPESPYDEVSSIRTYSNWWFQLTDIPQIFLVSCLFHHVSILKLTIHSAYTHYLTTGILPQPTPAEEDWCSPPLERTEWYDLFDQESRVDAFRCIWGVMEYATRDVATGGSGAVSTGDGAQT